MPSQVIAANGDKGSIPVRLGEGLEDASHPAVFSISATGGADLNRSARSGASPADRMAICVSSAALTRTRAPTLPFGSPPNSVVIW